MFFKQWEVLLIDDDPDILQISQLAMRQFEVYGLPLHITTAQSRAEAIEYLQSRPNIHFGLPLALVDVVMESDDAGLQLCQYIRESMGNRLTQLYIRTGQPGIAPERSVIDRYDISGYFTKHEVTKNKLYSFVKAGIRQFLWSSTSYSILAYTNIFMMHMGSRAEITKTIAPLRHAIHAGIGPNLAEDAASTTFIILDDQLCLPSAAQEEKVALALRDQLLKHEGIPLSGRGDKYVYDAETNYHLLSVTAGPGRSRYDYIFRTLYTPPFEIIELLYLGNINLATAWHWSS